MSIFCYVCSSQYNLLVYCLLLVPQTALVFSGTEEETVYYAEKRDVVSLEGQLDWNEL